MQSLHQEVMETIDSFFGTSLTSYERFNILKLENQIGDLKAHVDGLKQTLQSLDQQYEANKAELEAQMEVDKSQAITLKEDIRAIEKKSEILEAYIGVLGTEEFSINALRSECDGYCKKTWVDLKYLNDQSNEIKSKLSRLKDLNKKLIDTRINI